MKKPGSEASTPSPDRLLTAREVGRWLHLEAGVVRQRARRGLLPCIRLGRRTIRFDRVAVQAVIDAASHKQ
jgi:hypothetical protein